MKRFMIASLLALIASPAFAAKYTLDASHSSVAFKIPHLMISSVPGRFDKFEGSFEFDEKKNTVTNIEVKIDVDSINTNEAKRDAHLKNEDFFGVRNKDGKLVEAKRWMTFKAAKADVKAGSTKDVKGDLTLNGVTKPVTLKVTYKGAGTDPWGNSKVGFEATSKISRKDFGLTWNKALETGGVVVGDEVTITIDGEANAAK